MIAEAPPRAPKNNSLPENAREIPSTVDPCLGRFVAARLGALARRRPAARFDGSDHGNSSDKPRLHDGIRRRGHAFLREAWRRHEDDADQRARLDQRADRRQRRFLAIVQLTDRIVVQVVLRKELAEAAGFDPKAPLAKRAAILKGRTMAVESINSIIDAYLGLLAKQGGFTHDDMHVAAMEPPEMISAFAAKRIDGFAMSLPWTLQPVVEGTAVMLASGPDGDTVGLDPFTNTVVATKPATCEKQPKLCEAVGQTFKETSAWIHAHPDEAEALLKKRFEKLDPKVFHASFETELKITPNPPVPTAKGIENTDNYNIEAGLMKPSEKQSDYSKLFTDKYVK
jgi:ABC-type nitrate/sulfonate/bicarbonate transport system substrate-binding protein